MSQDVERWMKRFQPPEPPRDLRRRIFGRSVAEQALGSGPAASRGSESDTEICGFPEIIVLPSRRRSLSVASRNRFWRRALLTATVGVVLLAVVVAFTATARRPVVSVQDLDADGAALASTVERVGHPLAATESDRTNSPVVMGLTPDERHELVACVVGISSVVWRNEAKIYSIHDRLRPGDSLSIESGRLELVFDCGVQLVLEGPADFEILGEKHARMATGIITARAWTGGEGFAIDTPQVNIVDLSTEFGVKVDATGKTDVAVFEGAIDVLQQGPETPASAADTVPERLWEGDVIRYGGGKNEMKDANEFDGELRAGNAVSFNIIEWHDRVTSGNRSGVSIMNLDRIVVDAGRDDCEGDWICSRESGKWVGDWYYHDMNADQGSKSIRFAVKLPKSGRYEVRMAYSAFLESPSYRRASNVPVDIEHSGGTERIQVDQRGEPPIDRLFLSLGAFDFDSDRPAVVTVSNRGADGFVTADAVQFLPVE